MREIRKIKIICLIALLILAFTPIKTEAASVKLNKSKCTLYVGKTTTLKVQGTRSKIKWNSSNTRVATVSNKGKVTAKKAGKATIVAKVDSKSYKCVVTVKKPYLNKTSLSLYVGKTSTLKITGTVAKSWKSSNTKVATVSNKGKITAQKAGKVTITCKGTDGKTYKCKLTVKSPYLNITKKTIHQCDSVNLKITGTTAKSWSSSNNSIATVNTLGKVNSWKAGNVTISCKGSNGEEYKCLLTVQGHSYVKNILQEPTCTSMGVCTFECSKCSDFYEEEIEILAHEYSEPVIVEPTCMESGYTYRECRYCGEWIDEEYLEQLPHDYSETIIQEPTCTEEGISVWECANCLSSFEDTILALDHNYGEPVIVEATCTTYGSSHRECTRCGEWTNEEFWSELGHEYSIEIIEEPTCETVGYGVYTCGRCGDSYEDEIDSLGHEYQLVVIEESTCTQYGNGYYICNRCNTNTGELFLELKSHEYNTIEVAASCEFYGGIYKECELCGNRELIEKKEEKLSHEYQPRTIEPTCYQPGGTQYKCKNCDDYYWGEDYVESIPHTWERRTLEQPTCEDTGWSYNVCTVCEYADYSSRQMVDPAAHDCIHKTDDTGIILSCTQCEKDLYHVTLSEKGNNKYLQSGMVSFDEEKVYMMPGTSVSYYVEDMSGEGWDYYVTSDLAEGEYTYVEFGDEIEISGKYDENVYLSMNDYISAMERGTNQLILYDFYGHELSRIEIEVYGYYLVEAYHKYAAGDMEALEMFSDEYREMIIIAEEVIRNNITDDMTDYEKAAAISSWIVSSISYANDRRYSGQSAVVAFTEHTAVCAGYSQTFHFFMEILGIPNYTVHGVMGGTGHAWNMIKVDAGNGKGVQWYYIEPQDEVLDWRMTKTVDEYQVGYWGSLYEVVSLSKGVPWGFLDYGDGETVWSMHDDIPDYPLE